MTKLGRPKLSADVACVCGTCGKEYKVPEWQPDGRKFCSRKCWAQSRIGQPAPNRVQPQPRDCPRCGQTFLVGGSGRPPVKQIFCSQDCANYGAGEARQMTEAEAAWLAGVIDGEGSIVQVRARGRTWRLVVYNTSHPFMLRVLEVAGCGRLAERKRIADHHKRCWVWTCYGPRTRALCRQMLPWLIVKRDKALQALDE